jgi:hypothetical protein
MFLGIAHETLKMPRTKCQTSLVINDLLVLIAWATPVYKSETRTSKIIHREDSTQSCCPCEESHAGQGLDLPNKRTKIHKIGKVRKL